MNEKSIGYAWNEEVENYCLAKRGRYNKIIMIEPIQEMKLSEMKLDNMSLYETLQQIFYKRTGKIDDKLGFTGRDYAIELAKELGVW